MTEHSLPQAGHLDAGIAYHIEWAWSPRAFLWNDRAKKRRKSDPCGINFYPLASRLRLWLLRRGGQIAYIRHERDGRGPLVPTNPFTESGSVLALMYADAINAAHAFTHSTAPMDELDAETRRMRFYSEIALLNARFSEACIKQLLYCTAIPTRDYKKVPLRGLLDRECRACARLGRPHKVSLLGSLAHRYGLCLEVEHCLDQHLQIANRRRNAQASHASLSGFEPKAIGDIRRRLDFEVKEMAEELIHLLQHIGRIEERMRDELTYALSVGMDDPWWRPRSN